MNAAVIVENMVLDRRAKGVPFVLNQVYLEIPAGYAVGVVGPSGCGKSTLLDLIALILRPSRLARLAIAKDNQTLIELRDQVIHGSADRLAHWRSRLIGYVLQTGGLLPFATVRENIALPRRLLGLTDNGIVGHLSKRLDITDLLERWPEQLSVGQRQRVAVARALAHEPPVIIADEPTASLDPATGDLAMQLMIDACYSSSATLIVATHDLERAQRFKLRLLRFTPSGENGSFAYGDDSLA